MTLEANKTRDIDDLLNELGYAFSTPEAEDFSYAINSKNYKKARKMLSAHFEKEEMEAIVSYFKKNSKRKYVLQEIAYEDFELMSTNDKFSNNFIVNYQGNLVSTNATDLLKGQVSFYFNGDFINFDKADQIWISTKK